MIQMQKVIKVGNSLAITLDKKFTEKAGISPGQEMAVVYKAEKGLVSLAKSSTMISDGDRVAEEKVAYLSGKVTPEFQLWVEKSLDEDAEAMSKLANL